jgi:hypothetical protein
MTKVAQYLKPFYSNLVHVTCVAHGIYRIAGKIIGTYHDNNYLILIMEKWFSQRLRIKLNYIKK